MCPGLRQQLANVEQVAQFFNALHVDMPTALCNRFASHVLQALVVRAMAFPAEFDDPAAAEPAVGEDSDDPNVPPPPMTMARAFFKLSGKTERKKKKEKERRKRKEQG